MSRPGRRPGRRCTHLLEMRFPARRRGRGSSRYQAGRRRSNKVELGQCRDRAPLVCERSEEQQVKRVVNENFAKVAESCQESNKGGGPSGARRECPSVLLPQSSARRQVDGTCDEQ